MTRPLRALRLRRLTASFGLALPAAIAAAGIVAAAATPMAAFAHSRHHRDSGNSDSPSPRSRETVRIRVLTARLRSGPSEERHSSALLDKGETAHVVAHRGDWTEVRTASGDRGWVRSDLLRVARATKSADEEPTPRRTRHHASDEDSAPRHRHHASEDHPAHVAAASSRPAPHHRPTSVAHAAAPHAKPAAAVAAAATAAHPKVAPARAFVRSAASVTTAAAPAPHMPAGRAEGHRLTVDSPTATMTISDAHITLAALNEKTSSPPAPAPETASPVTAAAAPTPEAQNARTAPATPVAVALASAKAIPAELDRSLSRGARLVRSALSYRGTPYRMGATGRGAFDCSGFTMYLFDKEGTQLPRTAEEQYAKGQPVSKSDLMPGDLVFFRNTYKHGISHVGIYIGNGQFCHAAGRGRGVRVDSLDKAFYVNHWAGARRPR